jgi:hypothetical protein
MGNIEPNIFNNLLLVIKRNKILLISLIILSALAGFIYAKFQKPIYKSNLTFALDSGSGESDFSGAAGIASQLGFSIGGSGNVFSNDNIVGIMLSRRIIEKVLTSDLEFDSHKTTMIEFYLNTSGFRNKFSKNDPLKNVHFNYKQNTLSYNRAHKKVLLMIYEEFKNLHISVSKQDKRLNIFSVQVKSYDENFTKIFTDRLVEETNTYYQAVCSKKAKDVVEILEKRVEEMKSRLSVNIAEKAEIQDANINPAINRALAPIQKKQFDIESYFLAYQELFKNLETARFQYLNKIPLMQIIDEANYPMQRESQGSIRTSLIFAFATSVLLMLLILIKIQFFKKH